MIQIRIVAIDDNVEEQTHAKEAIEAAGHEAVILRNLSYDSEWMDQIEKADGVITDLFFDPQANTNSDVREAYASKPPAMGLIVACHLASLGKRAVICTSGYHHGPELSFVFDAYIGPAGSKSAFQWEENKNWAHAVELLETGKVR